MSANSAAPSGLPYSLIQPRLLNARAVLPPSKFRHEQRAQWLVSTVLYKQATGRVEPRYDEQTQTVQDYVPLLTTNLQGVMGKDASDIKKRLVDANVLETHRSYMPGQFSKGYRISERFAADGYRWITPTQPCLIRR